jgi:beta-xylosidase
MRVTFAVATVVTVVLACGRQNGPGSGTPSQDVQDATAGSESGLPGADGAASVSGDSDGAADAGGPSGPDGSTASATDGSHTAGDAEPSDASVAAADGSMAAGNDAGLPPAMTCSVSEFGDQGDGSYANPILPGDYQNTDVVRVGADYYYITATKALAPGMMVLHSNDLVNWTAIGHVVPDITQINARYNYDQMNGEEDGIWAGAIAYHDGLFYVYFTTPDEGIYVSTATNPAGPWAPLTQLMAAAGWDDPCPFWDDDGQAYLVTTQFAVDPANGKTYNVHLFKMAADGKSLTAGSGTIIHQSTGSEANKLFKLNGYYYHFFSQVTGEGRVPMIERATSLSGPWQEREVNHVTDADREPNQGTILQSVQGDWFFITHHGTPAWEGRPASLLPVTWTDGWPAAGRVGADGIGNMVWSGTMPVGGYPVSRPQTSDDFSGPTLSPQWEWNFQPRVGMWSLTDRPGFLRLRAFKALQSGNLLKTGNVLTQRPLRSENNVATVSMDISQMADGEQAGFGFLGSTSGTIGVSQAQGVRHFVFTQNATVTTGPTIGPTVTTVWLRTSWSASWAVTGPASFQFSTDGTSFSSLGPAFVMTDFGAFLGAKIAIYTVNDAQEAGYVDVDDFESPCSK